MEFAGDVGPPLALKECEGNESQPVDPRSKKENLSDRSGEQRKIGSYPIAKERRGEDGCWRTYRRIAISKRRQRTSAQCPRAVSAELDMRGKDVRATAPENIWLRTTRFIGTV